MSGYDSTPSPRFLKGLQNQQWRNGVVGSLAEFVDNSFDPARGDASRVDVDWDPKHRILRVIDNGRGMEEGVGPLFKLGAGVGLTPGSIGVYGNGGKLALLWLGSKVGVTTLRDGKVNGHGVVWKEVFEAREFPVISTDWEDATFDACPKSLLVHGHGTQIIVKVPRTRKLTPSKVRRDLAARFGPGLRQDREIVWRTLGKNGETHRLSGLVEDPADPLEDTPFDFVIEYKGEHLPVSGKIGLYPDLNYQQSTVAVGFGYRRLQETRDCYRSPDGEESYTGVGVAGYVDLIGWPATLLTQTKEGIDDAELYDALMAKLFEIARPFLEQVKKEELHVVFDDLVLGVEGVLNGNNGHRFNVEVLVTEDDGGDLFVEHDPTGKRKGKNPRERRATEDDAGQDGQQEEGKQRSVKIVRLSNDQMLGELCAALEANEYELKIGVNEDHAFVQAAMDPPNQLAFNALITREIAHVLAEDERMLKKAFPPRLWKKLPEGNGDGRRERLLHRYLLELVHS